MSADILEFKPRPNPQRDATAVLIENVKIVYPSPALLINELRDEDSGLTMFYQIETDTAPSEYCAPHGDMA